MNVSWNGLKTIVEQPATGTIVNAALAIAAIVSLVIGVGTLQDAKSASERTAVNSEPQVDVMSRFGEHKQLVFDVSNYGVASANYVQVACITDYTSQPWPTLSDADKEAIVDDQQILIRRLSAGGPAQHVYSSECRGIAVPKGAVVDGIFIFVAYTSAAGLRHYDAWLYQVDRHVNGFLQTVPVTDPNVKAIFDFYKRTYNARQGSIDAETK